MARQATKSVKSICGARTSSENYLTDEGPSERKRPKTTSDKSGSKPAAELVVAATPIGNMGDLSPRTVEALKRADLVACEDTRVTGKLLHRLGLKKTLTPYHEHNAAKARPFLIEKLKKGENVVLVSDAGTPLISDPGYQLVRACYEEGIPVTATPGPSALLTALVLSGLPADRFLFAGFLPSKQGARRTVLTDLKGTPATLIFYESAKRLGASLADMARELGNRPAAVARELTKLHEEVRRGNLEDLARHYGEVGPPKGEVVLVIGPPLIEALKEEDLDRLLVDALRTMSLKDAAAAVAEATGASKRSLYNRALELKG